MDNKINMGRTKNAKALSMYKYKVTCNNVTSYFKTQIEIKNEYPYLNKSYIYKILNCPEKVVFHRDIEISKLSPPIPVFSTKIREILFINQEEKEEKREVTLER